MDPNTPMNRRAFFRRGLGELLRPLAGAIDNAARAAGELAALDKLGTHTSPAGSNRPVPRGSPVLRPPGALEDEAFLQTCQTTGACVSVCPAKCIVIEPAGRGGGKPFIHANTMPCVVCDGLYCMHACPTGALVVTPLTDIDMGTAVWNADICLRKDGTDCQICVAKCPVGEVAIRLIDGRIEVQAQGCIGCGVCQHECPTDPKSILVIPAESRRR